MLGEWYILYITLPDLHEFRAMGCFHNNLHDVVARAENKSASRLGLLNLFV